MRPLIPSLTTLTLLQVTWVPAVEVVSLAPDEIPQPIVSRSSNTAEEAIRNLAFGDKVLARASEQATALAQLVEIFASGEKDALSLAEALLSGGSEAEVAAGIRIRLLMDQGRYAEAGAAVGAGPIFDALVALPPERYESLAEPISTRLGLMLTGSPTIGVSSGGETADFVLDTGAGYSLVRESDVERLGVKIPEGPEIPLGSATDISITARFGWLPEVSIGSVRIRNHHVLVVPDEMLDIDELRQDSVTIGSAGGWQTIETDIAERLSLVISGHRFDLSEVRREQQEDSYFVMMDGVLGADLAQRCVMTIDYPNRHFALRVGEPTG